MVVVSYVKSFELFGMKTSIEKKEIAYYPSDAVFGILRKNFP